MGDTHPFTQATLAVAFIKIDNAIAKLEEYAETCGEGVHDPLGLFGHGYGELLGVRGLLQAAAQIEVMAEDIRRRNAVLEVMDEDVRSRDTDRPSSMRVVVR